MPVYTAKEVEARRQKAAQDRASAKSKATGKPAKAKPTKPSK